MKWAEFGQIGKLHKRVSERGFTIVELLIVIVVIAILAAIAILSYGGIVEKAKETGIQSELRDTAVKAAMSKAETGTYPTVGTVVTSRDGSTTTTYVRSGPNSYCANAVRDGYGTPYYVTEQGAVAKGECPVLDGSLMQVITKNNCPSVRTRAVDARDNHTYWVQKLADGKCWMLTDLAYTGGGVNTFKDTHTLNSACSDFRTDAPCVYISSWNVSTYEPTSPSVATNGNGQYGVYYNWCGVMGGQLGTTACSIYAAPLFDGSQTICPSGWGLPSGGGSGDYVALNNAINSGDRNNNAGLLTIWLGQNNGTYFEGYQGTHGLYWAGSVDSNPSTNAHTLSYYTYWHNNPDDFHNKSNAYATRCLIK